MSVTLLLTLIIGYFLLLIIISRVVSRGSKDDTFFTGDKQSPWYLVAFGMVGAALSGVTFVSLPGMVGNNHLHFTQFIIGNLLGYLFINFYLIPLYFKRKLVSIYGYLEDRFGFSSYKTGALIFLVSQSFGAALRLMLAVKIIQYFFLDDLGIHHAFTSVAIVLLVGLYTQRSGIKTLVYTDTLQTSVLLIAVFATIYYVTDSLDLGFADTVNTIKASPLAKIFDWEWSSGNNFFKQVLAGFLITVSMNGLDQNMMQKTLTINKVSDAQKNNLSYSFILAFTQFLFMLLGILLYVFATQNNALPEMQNGVYLKTDNLFPNIVLNFFGGSLLSVFFILGIIATSFSSIDSSLTSLTTTFVQDFMRVKDKQIANLKNIKNRTFIGFSLIILAIMLLFWGMKGDIISNIFKIAGYTYGPLLGMFAWGIFTNNEVKDKWVPLVCILSPIITYGLYLLALNYFGFDFGFVSIGVNTLLTIIGLYFIRKS